MRDLLPGTIVKADETGLAYFASDGNYGIADGLVILDTRDWTSDDWEDIEYASDENRAHVAQLIALAKKESN